MTQSITQHHSQTETKHIMTNTKPQDRVKDYFNSDQKKGLMLYGPNGTGKSTAMRPYTKTMWHGSALQYASVIAKNGTDYINKYSMHDMYIDDLGRERTTVSNYGDNITPLHDLLHFRYEVFIQSGYKTHISTNLTLKELADRYGTPIADRLKEMCTIIEMKGESLRA